jgi:hypothetical protein
MALKQLFTNNAVSLLKFPITADAVSLQVLDGHGDMFPTPQENEFFTVTLENQTASAREIIFVTQRQGDIFTIVRGRENTFPHAWSASASNDTLVDHRLTAETLYRLSNVYSNEDFPNLTDYKDALDYLLAQKPISGEQMVDAPYTTYTHDGKLRLITLNPYKLETTVLFVGGMRQKRNLDFIEINNTTLQLQYPISSDDIARGQNIVVDYVIA